MKYMKAKEAREKYLPKFKQIQAHLEKALSELETENISYEEKFYLAQRLIDIIHETVEVINNLKDFQDDFEVYEDEIEMKLRLIRNEIADLPLFRVE
ncbi:hypothetical protein STIV2_C96 [Sulfolobus turreted icosahedral virus 2]|uniref:Uncharacterized protein n=1 Tax=Sulfolobus turreted icosahedral virus 2 TaxID=754004 RepID=D5IEZ4_9VIRU|nr:hypothetical protein STIV2_C96 [Sulfolobus turreted icosahedral virus 2]ADF27765.1 hypothetical protein STIV2_C96 [Sulfolobus turreted icosahedral virus 2]